jgi:hypothetical protein
VEEKLWSSQLCHYKGGPFSRRTCITFLARRASKTYSREKILEDGLSLRSAGEVLTVLL